MQQPVPLTIVDRISSEGRSGFRDSHEKKECLSVATHVGFDVTSDPHARRTMRTMLGRTLPILANSKTLR